MYSHLTCTIGVHSRRRERSGKTPPPPPPLTVSHLPVCIWLSVVIDTRRSRVVVVVVVAARIDAVFRARFIRNKKKFSCSLSRARTYTEVLVVLKIVCTPAQTSCQQMCTRHDKEPVLARIDHSSVYRIDHRST